jgi:hypothetical protein
VSVYPSITASLNLNEIVAQSLTASHIYYATGHDLAVEVPQLLADVGSQDGRLTAVEQKTSPLSYANNQLTVSVPLYDTSYLYPGGNLASQVPSLQSDVAALQAKTASLSYNAATSTLTVSSSVVQSSGTATLGALSVPSIACSGTISGTLTTATQPNITALGILTSLACSGTITQSGGTAILRATTCTSLTVNGAVLQPSSTASLGALTIPSLTCSGAASLGATTVTGGFTADSGNIAGISITSGCIAIPKPASTNPQLLWSATFDGTTFRTATGTGTSVYSFRMQQAGFGSGGNRVDVDVSSAAGSNSSSIASWINIASFQQAFGMVLKSNFQCLNASLAYNNSGRYVEVSANATDTSFTDYHSKDGQTNDYDCRVISTGGSTSGAAGQGTLGLLAAGIGLGQTTCTSGYQCDLAGYIRLRVPCFSAYRSGSWTVTVNAGILASATVDFNNTLSGTALFDSTLGVCKPGAGSAYYRFEWYCRVADSTSNASGFIPAVYDASTVSYRYLIQNSDHTFWVQEDPSGRRVASYSVTVYLTSPNQYFLVTTQSNATTWQEARLSGSFVSW